MLKRGSLYLCHLTVQLQQNTKKRNNERMKVNELRAKRARGSGGSPTKGRLKRGHLENQALRSIDDVPAEKIRIRASEYLNSFERNIAL
jgi:hypothetical protein